MQDPCIMGIVVKLRGTDGVQDPKGVPDDGQGMIAADRRLPAAVPTVYLRKPPHNKVCEGLG